MTIFYQKHGVTSDDLVGAIEKAILNNLKSHFFSFSEAPQIRLEDRGNKIHISLFNGGFISRPLMLSKDWALLYAKRFADNEPVSDVLLRKIYVLWEDLRVKESGTV